MVAIPLAGALALDVTPDAEATAGNLYDYVGLGATMRVGVDLRPDTMPVQGDPAMAGSGAAVRSDNEHWIYVFAGVHGRAVARNLLLDGNTFRDSRDVDQNGFVGDLSAGVAADWKRVRVARVKLPQN